MQNVGLDSLDLLDKKDLRIALGKVSLSTVERIIRSGEIEVTRIGRLVRFTPEAVRAYIDSRPRTPAIAQSDT